MHPVMHPRSSTEIAGKGGIIYTLKHTAITNECFTPQELSKPKVDASFGFFDTRTVTPLWIIRATVRRNRGLVE